MRTPVYGVRSPGIFAEEIVKADLTPDDIGVRRDVTYAMTGDTLTLMNFARAVNPDPTSGPWKRETSFKRAADSDCQ